MGKPRRFATRTIPKLIPLSFDDDSGNAVTENFKVTYRSYSNRALDDLAKLKGDEQGNVPYCDYLGLMVESIVDEKGEPLTNDTGEPAPMTNDFFAELALSNAKALYDAIQENINPSLASSEPGASGSAQAVSEA